jgi:hypothetical protein
VTLTVKQRAEYVATFRHVHVFFMEMLARWTPSTPEMEAKLLLGRDIWEQAQQADTLGRRTQELRAKLHFSLPPTAGYRDFLQRLASLEASADRLAGFYDVALPGLARRYEVFLAQTDPLLDAPSVGIVQRILAELAAMRERADELRRSLPALRATSDLAALAVLERSDSSIVAGRSPNQAEEAVA